jgi:ATP sulfurylase
VFDDENKTVFISEEEVNGVLKAYNLNNEFPFEIPLL